MSEQNLNPMGREYTPSEWAAARRVGVAEKQHSSKNTGGPLIYACGPYYPEHARKMAEDWKTLADALDREWKKEVQHVRE